MDTNQRLWMNRICVWLLWSSVLVKALVFVDADGMKSSDAGSSNVVAYWERRLHAPMPGSIRSMVTPLSEDQSTQLLAGSKDLLPGSATFFCKAAHIKCGHQISEGQPDSDLPLQQLHQPNGGLQLSYYDEDLGEQANPSNDLPHDHPQAKIMIPILLHYEHPMKQADSGSQVPEDHPHAKTMIQILLHYEHPMKQADFGSEVLEDHPQAKTMIPILLSYEHPMKQGDSGSEVLEDHPQAKTMIPVSLHYEHPMKQGDSGSQVLEDHPQAKTMIPILLHYEHPMKQADSGSEVLEDHPQAKTMIPILLHYEHPMKQADSGSQVVKDQPHPEGQSKAMPHIPREQVGPPEGHRLLVSHSVEEVELFFLPKVLQPGRDLYLKVANGEEVDDERVFLPRKLAKLFPIDSPGDEVKIESMLGVSLNDFAKISLDMCESRNIHSGEAKACPTSMEELVDFVSDVLMDAGNASPGRSGVVVEVRESLSNSSSFRFAGRRYRVVDVKALKEVEEPSVVCHDILGVPFRTFYCHKVPHAQSLAVALRAEEDGSIHERIVNCHHDTSYWNPDHPAFHMLGFKPGEGPACHFLGLSWSGADAWLFLRA